MVDMQVFDREEMQNMQDSFCKTHHVYAVCMDMNYEPQTMFYGNRDILAYFKARVDGERQRAQVYRMRTSLLEEVVEESFEEAYLKMCMIAIRVRREVVGFWCVYGILREHVEDLTVLPQGMETVSGEKFESAVELLCASSKRFFQGKIENLEMREENSHLKREKEQLKLALDKKAVMVNIIQLMESKQGFIEVMNELLGQVGTFLQISHAGLLRMNQDYTVDLISEWRSETQPSLQERMQGMTRDKLPFLTGRPYMISSDSMMPKEFMEFERKINMKAGIALPVEVNDHIGMYLTFAEMAQERTWNKEEIRFLNDVKKIVQSMLNKRLTQNSLTSSYISLEAILENVGCGVCVKDPRTKVVLYTNYMLRQVFQKSMQTRSLEQILSDDKLFVEQPESREFYAGEEDKWFDIQNTQITWVDGRTVQLYTIYDVTDKKNYQQRIEKQANNDFLTGLYNRMRCEQDLEEYISQTKEFGNQGALLYMDLDDFKHINDGLGHQYGDVLLKAIAHDLREIPQVGSNCYRMGGDEFIIIVTNHQFFQLKQIVEEIRRVFMKPWFLKGTDYYCTMSMGIVRFPQDGDSVSDLIKKADIALYEAKKSGKNRVEYYDESVELSSFKRLDLEKNMRNATADDCREFEVYYQPIIDVSKPGNPCSGAEALIRWNSKNLGMIAPTEFIPLAEYLGLINPIGSFILEEACKTCRYWNEMGHPEYKVNINLSVIQLLRNDMVENVRDTIERTGVNPENLVLEVTESLAINDMGRMKRILQQIKRLGVQVALDDFGTGYSSLNHIREMPIDVIKIDRCFIMDIGKDDYSCVFVKMVKELANTINVRVCVEGVEEIEQYEKLVETKVDLIQGFYFDKPLRRAEFEEKYL